MTCSLPCFVPLGAPGALGIATTSLTAPGTDKLHSAHAPASFTLIKAELGISTGVERGSHLLHAGESLLCQRPMPHAKCQPSKENVVESLFARGLYVFNTFGPAK